MAATEQHSVEPQPLISAGEWLRNYQSGQQTSGQEMVPALDYLKSIGAVGAAPVKPLVPPEPTWVQEFEGLALSAGIGATSGLTAAGAVLELAFPETGAYLRRSGQSGTDYLIQNLPPAYRDAIDKDWLDLSAEGALRSPRAWAIQLAQQLTYLPLVVATGGAAEAGVLAAMRAVGVAGAKKAAVELAATTGTRTAAQTAAAKIGFGAAGGGFGAGEAAAGVGQAADEAGLTDEERVSGMRTAAAIGFAPGAFLGHTSESLLAHGGGAVRRAIAAGIGEAVEEGGTGAGTEAGKAQIGLPWSVRNVVEQAVAGAASGVAVGATVLGRGAEADRKQREKDVKEHIALTTAQKEADAAEVEAMLVKLRGVKAGAAVVPDPTPPPSPGASKDPMEALLAKQAQIEALNRKVQALPHGEQRAIMTSQLADLKKELPDLAKRAQPHAPKAGEAAIVLGQDPKSVATADKILQGQGMEEVPKLTKKLVEVQKRIDRLVGQTDRHGKWQAGVITNTPPQDVKNRARYANNVRKLNEQKARLKTQINQIRRVGMQQPYVPGLEPGILPGDEQVSEVPQPLPETIQTLDDAMAEAGGRIEDPRQIDFIDEQIRRSQQARNAARARWDKAKGVVVDAAPPPESSMPDATGLPQQPMANPPATAQRSVASKRGAAPPPAPRAALPVTPGAATPTPEQAAVAVRSTAQAPSQVPGNAAVEAAKPVPIPPELVAEPRLADQKVDAPQQPQEMRDLDAPEAKPADPLAPRLEALEGARPMPRMPPLKRQVSVNTPADAIKLRLTKGPQPAGDLLRQVLRYTAPDSKVGDLAKRLLMAFPTDSFPTVQASFLNDGYQALYDPKTDTIHIDTVQAEDVQTAFLHEVVHAATLGNVRANPEAKRKAAELLRLVRNRWDMARLDPHSAQHPGFTTPEEFIAHALTDPVFADQLGKLMIDQQQSAWTRFKNFIYRQLPNPPAQAASAPVLEQVINFIPNGRFLQNQESRREILAELSRLGMDQGAALMSTFRAAMRPATRDAAWHDVNRRFGSPRWTKLQTMAVNQIVQSYGYLWDGIGRYYGLIEEQDGHQQKVQRLATRVSEMFANVRAQGNAQALDDLIIDARMWGLHPDRPLADPTNGWGARQPGSTALYAELVKRWRTLSDRQKVMFSQLRAAGEQYRADSINQMVLAVLRTRRLPYDPAALAALQAQAVVTRPVNIVHGSDVGIDFDQAVMLTKQQVDNFITMSTALSQEQADSLKEQLHSILTTLGGEQGPYFPLRRYGDYFVQKRTDMITEVMSAADLDRKVEENKRQNGGDMIVMHNRAVNRKNPQSMRKVSYYYQDVQMADDELSAAQLFREMDADWDRRGLNKHGTHKTTGYHLRKATSLQDLQLSRPAFTALQDAVEKALGGNSGKQAADFIGRHMLEALPDTSVRKAALRARRVAGASRDTARAFADFSQNQAYFSAAMRYGHRIAALLGSDLDKAIEAKRVAKDNDGANDLRLIGDHFKGMEESQRDQREDTMQRFKAARQMWKRIPQLAGAWLLTGWGTMTGNLMQPIMLGVPWLGARYGNVKAARIMGDVVRVVARPGAREAFKEIVPGAKKTLKNVAAAISPTRFKPGGSIKDPLTPFFEHLSENLAPREQALMHKLADMGKLDFGQVADIKAIAAGEGRGAEVLTALTEWMFAGAQAIETTNRVVMAVTAWRLTEAERQAGTMSETDAEAFVAQALDSTQFNYTAHNKPNVFRNEALRPALVFKTYPQNVLYNVLHYGLQGFFSRSASAQDKAFARKFVTSWFGFTAAAAGVGGFLSLEPFYVVAVALMSALGSDEDDPEEALAKLFNDWFSPAVADALQNGIPYGALGVDTTRLGLSGMIDIGEIRNKLGDPEADINSVYQQLGMMLGGVPASVGADIWKGAGALASGDFQTAGRMMTPKAYGINDAFRVWEYSTTGVRTGNGYTVIQPEDISLFDRIVRGLGWAPAHLQKQMTVRNSNLRRDKALHAERTDLLTRMGDAVLDNDQQEIREIADEIAEFNQANPKKAITQRTVRSSLERRNVAADAIRTFGVAATTKAQAAEAMRTRQEFGLPPTN